MADGTLATVDLQLRTAFPHLLEPGLGEIPRRQVNDGAIRYGSLPDRSGADWSEIGSHPGVLRRRALADAEAGRRR